jgi:hypothetical protein
MEWNSIFICIFKKTVQHLMRQAVICDEYFACEYRLTFKNV